MPTVPISMRKLKEILRFKYGSGLSHRQIGRSLAISPSVASRYANRAAQLGIKQWPLSAEWDDAALKYALLQTQVKMKKHSLPDWATVHKEPRNKCVTLQLLWEEYGERNPPLLIADIPMTLCSLSKCYQRCKTGSSAT